LCFVYEKAGTSAKVRASKILSSLQAINITSLYNTVRKSYKNLQNEK